MYGGISLSSSSKLFAETDSFFFKLKNKYSNKVIPQIKIIKFHQVKNCLLCKNKTPTIAKEKKID